MRKTLLHKFFKELDQELKRPAEIILTGAVAGSLFGVTRPSVDLDFEIRARSERTPAAFFQIKDAVEKVASRIGIAVNFSENIGHWSMIDPLDYRKAALPYAVIGKLRVRVMEPGHWTIGKMARFLEVDIRDVARVIKRKKLKPKTLVLLWGRALSSSPLSLDLGSFRRNVTYFIKRYGKQVWGKRFDARKGAALFERSMGFKTTKPSAKETS